MPRDNQLRLTGGRFVYLRALNQYLTYEGLIEGLPTVEFNKRIVERALQRAGQPRPETKPYLIQPTEKMIDYGDGKKYPFGIPAQLPGVICEARFRSLEPAREESCDYSWLTIVWFQNDFAMPIESDIQDKIKVLDWESLANDDEY